MGPIDRVWRRTTQLERGIVVPCAAELTRLLDSPIEGHYLDHRASLKQYLTLRDVEHLDVEWATARYLRLFSRLSSGGDLSASDLKARFSPHLRYYFDHLKSGSVEPLQLEEAIVDSARASLQSVVAEQRHYDLFVDSLADARIDESAELVAGNAVFPGVALSGILDDRQRQTIRSRSSTAGHGEYQVRGPYTSRGRAAVVKQLEVAAGLLQSEAWVVPLTKEDRQGLERRLRGVALRYEETYTQVWVDLFLDLRLDRPTTSAQAIALLEALAIPPYAHALLLAALKKHTQPSDADPFAEDGPEAREAVRRLEARWEQARATGATVTPLATRTRVANRFANENASGAIDLAHPGQGHVGDTSLTTYIEILKTLREQMIAARDKPRENAAAPFSLRDMAKEVEQARSATRGLLARHDAMTAMLLEELLLAPLSAPSAAATDTIAPAHVRR